MVGTVRAVPFGHQLTLAEQLRAQIGVAPGDTHVNGWEMGRLVISPDYRGGPESLKGFLYLSLSFLHGLSPVGSLHATCTPALARLYRRFGFSVIAKEVPLLGTAKTYTVIHGYFDEVIAALAEHQESAPAPLAPAMLPAHAATNNRGVFA